MSATKRTFSDPPDSIIYWDSSFTLAALVPGMLWHMECLGFRNRLESDGVLSVTCEFVYDEVAFIRLRNLLAAEASTRGMDWQALRRTDTAFYQSLMPRVDALWRDIGTATIDLPVSSAVRARAFQLMKDFNLLPTDAYHIAVALEAGVTTFASLDADFLGVDGITVYTCLP